MWDKIQQLIRISLYAGGGAVFGAGITSADQYVAGVGAVIDVTTFVWWLYWEWKRKRDESKKLVVAAQTGNPNPVIVA